mgnify:CR=1 FL=1
MKYALELEAINVIIREALSDLEQYEEASESSELLESLIRNRVFTNISTASEYLNDDIARLISFFQTDSVGGCIRMKTHVRWQRKKKDYLELFLRLENMKSNLHLCILTISSAYLRARWGR